VAELRHLRDAFEAALVTSAPDRAEEAEARVADLEHELREIAAKQARILADVDEGEPASPPNAEHSP
jgi:hypothetical protein